MTDRKCLVIGAAGGIGRQLVELLHRDGWSLVLAGRTPDALGEIAATCGAQTACLDARDFDAVDAVFQAHPGITGAVNLAGSILLRPAHLTTAQDFEDTISLNLRTAFALTRAAGKHMKSTGGSVVLMSSCAASVGLPNHEAIAAAKAGVEGAGACRRCDLCGVWHPLQRRRPGPRRHADGQADHRERGSPEGFGGDAPAGAHWTAGGSCPRDHIPAGRGKCVDDRAGAWGGRRARPLEGTVSPSARASMISPSTPRHRSCGRTEPDCSRRWWHA